MLTASFSEARQNLTAIAERVSREGVEYTVFKRSKPLFKIVPVREPDVAAAGLTRRDAARRAVERAGSEERTAVPSASVGVVMSGGEVPDGGMELFEYAMRLRERSSLQGKITDLTAADLKRELADRDV